MPYKNKADLIKYRQTEHHKKYMREYMKKYKKLYLATKKGKEANRKAFTKYNSSKGKEYKNKRREIVNKLKVEIGCLNPHCQWNGDFSSCMLDFHHINPEAKLFCIGLGLFRSIKSLEQEIKKCTVVCSNCHRKITSGEVDASNFPLCEYFKL